MKYDREKMAHWLVVWRQSGQTVSQFCQRHQLSKASFYYWRSKLEDAQGGRKSSFVSVRASVDPFPLASIHYPNGVRVDVFMPLDSDQIRKLAGC